MTTGSVPLDDANAEGGSASPRTINALGDRVPPFHFSDRDRAAAFRAICKSWDRTPFIENWNATEVRSLTEKKGPAGGNDCVGFVEDTYFETGEFPRFHFPRAAGDYRTHAHNDKILRFMRGTYRAPGSEEVDPQSIALAAIFLELTNLDELVPIAAWPAKPVINTGLLTGDICVMKSPIPGVWHLPVMQDDRTFAHCAFPLGVTEGDITQAEYRSRLKAVFRARAQVSSLSAIRNPQPDIGP